MDETMFAIMPVPAIINAPLTFSILSTDIMLPFMECIEISIRGHACLA